MPELRAVPSESSAEKQSSTNDSVLRKTDQILGAFARGHSTLGLTELSRRSGVSKSSAHRLAVELVELGYLSRTPDGYQLGWRIYEFGMLVPGPAALRDVARPIMQDVRTATGAIVHLSVRQGDECVYLDRVAGRGDLATVEVLGERVPQHTTASGRVFLAFADDATLARLDDATLAALGLPPSADPTQHLLDIRERRYAVESSTVLRGVKGIAVPVMYPRTDHVIAALSVSLPMNRKDDQRVVRVLWAASADISRGLEKQSSPRRLESASGTQPGWGRRPISRAR